LAGVAILGECDLRSNGPFGLKLGFVGGMGGVPAGLQLHADLKKNEDEQTIAAKRYDNSKADVPAMLLRQSMVPAETLATEPTIPNDPLSCFIAVDRISTGISGRKRLGGGG
jgi:hypothetical protein